MICRPIFQPAETIIKGDTAIASIAAASIIAKVTRDRLMRRLCVHYPVYRFSTAFWLCHENPSRGDRRARTLPFSPVEFPALCRRLAHLSPTCEKGTVAGLLVKRDLYPR